MSKPLIAVSICAAPRRWLMGLAVHGYPGACGQAHGANADDPSGQ